MTAKNGSASGTTKSRIGKKLHCSGRSARRTRYRCRFDYGRTYGGEEIDDDPTVCLECRLPARRCNGEYLCYLKQKQKRERKHTKTQADYLLESWKPTGIYDIWGENI